MQFFYAPYRTDGAVQYKTPAFHGLSGRFMMSNGEATARDVSSAPRWSTAKARCSWAWPASNNTKDIFGPEPGALLPRQLPVAVYRIGAVEPTFIFHSYNGYYAYPPYIAFNARVGTYSSARVGKSMAATASTPAWSAVDDETSACPAPPAWALSTACPSAPTCTPASPVLHDRAAPVIIPELSERWPEPDRLPDRHPPRLLNSRHWRIRHTPPAPQGDDMSTHRSLGSASLAVRPSPACSPTPRRRHPRSPRPKAGRARRQLQRHPGHPQRAGSLPGAVATRDA